VGASIRVIRVFGIDVGIHWSWVFIFLIVTWSFAMGVLDHFYPGWTDAQLWLAGAAVSAVFFLSVLLHELSHAVVSNRNGLPVRSITLFVFGGVANLTREPDTPEVELRIAAVGPLTSLALGAFFAALWAILLPFSEGLAGISANMSIINVSLALFNMLPGFPLDGGRVLRSIIWARNGDRLRATRIVTRAGEWIAYGVMGLGVVYTLFGYLNGLWFLLVGFFLRNIASGSYEQLLIETTLSGISARDVMQEPELVSPDASLTELVEEHILRRNARAFPVVEGGEFAGLITLTDVKKIPRDDWPLTPVRQAMTPAARLHVVSPDDSVASVLRLMASHDVNQVPVLRGRELAGILARADIIRLIQTREELSREQRLPKQDAPEPAADEELPRGVTPR
jgi:Zn-dependent protease